MTNLFKKTFKSFEVLKKLPKNIKHVCISKSPSQQSLCDAMSLLLPNYSSSLYATPKAVQLLCSNHDSLSTITPGHKAEENLTTLDL